MLVRDKFSMLIVSHSFFGLVYFVGLQLIYTMKQLLGTSLHMGILFVFLMVFGII